jgi:hypothetical protein
MALKRTFLVTFSLFLLVWAFSAIDRMAALWVKETSSERLQFLAANSAVQTQVEAIDRQILELQEMKKGYEARALRHEDYAQRLQFEDRALLETRRHLELAEENRAKANRVQEDIDRLQIERSKLLQAR